MNKERKRRDVMPEGIRKEKEFDISTWKPRTALGKKVKDGEIKEIKDIFDKGLRIMEVEIVNALLPELETILLSVGQSKGKFGGGKRSIWKQTQKKSKEGNKTKFSTLALVGNKDGYVGIGYGSSKETMPAREKAIRDAKLNLIRIKRGCGSWTCSCQNPHSIPFKIEGKCSSTKIELIPAPKGTRLCIEKECQKIMEFAGIKDIYSKTRNSKTKLNLVKACFDALKRLSKVKVKDEYIKKAGIKTGKIK